jgi:hypothetical protein
VTAEYRAFQWQYLAVYFIAMGADWLQGPYVYALYKVGSLLSLSPPPLLLPLSPGLQVFGCGDWAAVCGGVLLVCCIWYLYWRTSG